MPGIGELLILGVVMLFAGGGGTIAAMLKREVGKRAKDTLESRVQAIVPEDLRQAAEQVDGVVRQVRGQPPRPVSSPDERHPDPEPR